MLATRLLHAGFFFVAALSATTHGVPVVAPQRRTWWKWPPSPSSGGTNPWQNPWGGVPTCDDNAYTTCLYIKNPDQRAIGFYPQVQGRNVASPTDVAQGEQDYIIGRYIRSTNNLKITIDQFNEVNLSWSPDSTKLDVSLGNQGWGGSSITAYFVDRNNQRINQWFQGGGNSQSYDTTYSELKNFKLVIELGRKNFFGGRAEIQGK